MAFSQEFVDGVMETLGRIDGVSSKKMFGGVGGMCNGKMFAIFSGSKVFFKADDRNRQMFEDAGMTRFMSDKKKKGMPYYEVPEDVVSDPDKLLSWAQPSIEMALGG